MHLVAGCLMAKPRVHEVAAELGLDSREVLSMLRELGERAKSPSHTMQPPVVRRVRALAAERYPQLRKRLSGKNPVQTSPVKRAVNTPKNPKAIEEVPREEHPAAAAARVRREILTRPDTDWERYGFTNAERARWIDAGVPEDRAQVAAIARDSSRRPDGLITADTLHMALDGGTTVLESLLAGSNAIRVEGKAARARGRELLGVNDDLRVITGVRAAGERDAERVTSTIVQTEWTPSAMPRLADQYAQALAVVRQVARAQMVLREQVLLYLRDGTIGGLLAAFARAHGVFHDGDELRRLATEGIVGDRSDFAAVVDMVDVFTEGVRSRAFHFLREGAARTLDAFTTGGEPPPAPAGIALLQAAREEATGAPWEVVVWGSDESGIVRSIRFSSEQLRQLLAGKRPGVTIETYSRKGGLSGSANAVVAVLSRPAIRVDEPAAGGVEIVPSEGPTELRDVVLCYRGDATGSEPSDAPSVRSEPDHRWVVRGHWRRQWHPSTKDHSTIWIDEHTSGPAEKPLLHVERVTVR